MSELAVKFYKFTKYHSHCLICGTKNDLQFHHCKPQEKLSEVHKIAKYMDLETTITEINKCVPLCDQDHKAVHMGLRKGWLDGQTDRRKPSDALLALPYMPYLRYLAKLKPQLFHRFCQENTDTYKKELEALKHLGVKSTAGFNLII